jgi:glycine/D-amino acid oxidase-like deaminating enzyme
LRRVPTGGVSTGGFLLDIDYFWRTFNLLRMLSFWETDSFLHYDTIIIGAGIVGLSTAISLKEQAPHLSVLVLERGLLPTGASTRNAGFACFGSLTEILSDLERNGPDQTLAVAEKRIRGLRRLRERLGDAAMDYQSVGGYELITEREMPALDKIDIANELLLAFYPERVYREHRDWLERFGFSTQWVRSLIHNPYEGHLHAGKLMQSLSKMAQEKGVDIRTGAEVMALEETAASVSVIVQEPDRESVTFRSQKVAVCTNAFTPALLPELGIRPGRGQVLITQPLNGLRWEGTFHFDEGFYYFRNVGKRVLFGGGRNLAFEEETSTRFEENATILTQLERLLREMILPGQPFKIEQRWAGIMGFSEDKLPIVREVSPRIVVGFACNGMGVSLASTIGDEVAVLLIS